MAKLSDDLKKRIIISLTDEARGKELIDAIEGSDEILTGSTAPSNSLGDNGNLYVNLINGDLYLKYNNVWELKASGGDMGVEAAFEDIEQPVGIKSAATLSISVNDASRTLTATPVGTCVCFIKGKRVEITTPKTANWTNAHGLHYFYINASGDLIVTTTFTESIITEFAFVSIVYWDFAAQKHIYFADERHGIKMSPVTHAYLHRTRGAAFDNGGRLLNFVVDGAGNLATHAQFTSNFGVIWDEDIRIAYPAQTQIPVFYRSGPTNWKRKDADAYPVIRSGQEGYVGAGGLLPYNNFDGTNWSLTQVDNNKFVLVHIFATNDIEYPVVAIQGQAQYNSKSEARDAAVTEIRNISGLPVAEFCPLGSVIFETSNSYTNLPKARIVSTTSGANYEDHRSESIRPGSLA